MPEFHFDVLRKVTMWHKTSTTVEAQTHEEAILRLGEGILEEFPLYDGEYMPETGDDLEPSQNGGNPTVEIIDCTTNNIVWDNARQIIRKSHNSYSKGLYYRD